MNTFPELKKAQDPNPTQGVPPIFELGTIRAFFHTILHSQRGVLCIQPNSM
jgi:hypothetical protein